MKKLILILFILTTLTSFAQDFQKPAEGKSMVYFVRYRGAKSLINFKYFDSEKYLGRATLINYFMYECDPGEHVFWVATENREYIKGDLKPNCVYVIEVQPYMRVAMGSADLHQIDPSDQKTLKKIANVIDNNEPSALLEKDEDQSSSIKKGMERYSQIKEKVQKMNPEWTFNCGKD